MSAMTLQDLAVGYRHGRTKTAVLSGLDVSLRAGEFTVLLGPNGAGKSTLIRTMSALQPAMSGKVLLDGTDVAGLSPRDRAKGLAVVLTQQVRAWGLRARDLVAVGRHPHTGWSGQLTNADERIIDDAIEATGSAPLADRQIAELSDGERQRVMVARALAQEPRAMILDEVTAFLDLPHRVDIMLLLRRLAHRTGAAMLLSTHDLDLALRTADRIWLIAGGQLRCGLPEALVLDGSFDAVFAQENVAFDRATGGFTVTPQPRGRAALTGKGIEAAWTRRALERLGFEIDANERGLRVDVLAGSGGWLVEHAGRSTRCDSLEQVSAALRGDVHSHDLRQ